MSIFEIFEKAKKDVKGLLDKSKTKALNQQEVTTINGFFNLHSLNCGNRPKVMQHMKKQVYKKARKMSKYDEQGAKYYYLATAEHKTGGQFVAFIYYTEELMEMLDLYYENVRPKPTREYNEYLFINTHGKIIHNVSNDLEKFIRKYDKTLSCNHTYYRQIVTTLSKRFMNVEQQRILHGMMTHSEATANRHYVLGNDDAVPHKLGIPLLGRLLDYCGSSVGRTVNSYIRATGLDKEVPDSIRQKLLEFYMYLDRQKHLEDATAKSEEPGTSRASPVPSDHLRARRHRLPTRRHRLPNRRQSLPARRQRQPARRQRLRATSLRDHLISPKKLRNLI